ncbi:MAG: PaaI family thioesterase [Syntrophaceae bacterium]|jgi:acyl-CoA thioesterase
MGLETDSTVRTRIENIIRTSKYFQSLEIKVLELYKGKCALALAARDEHTNIHGTVHGGVLAALADSACGMALLTELAADEITVTLSLNMNYIHPAGICSLTAKSSLISRRRSTAVLEADIFDPAGNLVARANSVLAIKKIQGDK